MHIMQARKVLSVAGRGIFLTHSLILLIATRFDDRDFFRSSGLPGRFIDTPVGQLACLHLLPFSLPPSLTPSLPLGAQGPLITLSGDSLIEHVLS